MVLTPTGILGGTFDPVHRGHLEIAQRAKEAAGLARIVFVPAGQPRLKPSEPSASAADRLNMLRLAVDGMPGFEVSDMELSRPGQTRTIDTLRDFRAAMGADEELFFILGLDVLAGFDEWIDPEGVAAAARLLAVSRPGYAGFDWEEFYRRCPYAVGRVECIHSAAIDISASELRRRLADGMPVGGLLPAAVERYIRERGLYKI